MNDYMESPAIYGRLSEDRGRVSTNVAYQLKEGRAYLTDRGLIIDEQFVFSDNDLSASVYSTRPRPGYQELLEAIRNNLVTVIIITEVPRLLRQVSDALELIALAKMSRLRMIETTGGVRYDLTTNQGIHDLLEAAVDASRESGKTSDRLKRKRKALAEEGRFNGGSRPYGYEGPKHDKYGRITNPGRIGVAIVEPEAAVLRETVARLLDGWPVRSIVRDLNARKVPAANGGLWHQSNLKRILTSKRIASWTNGDLSHGIREHQGKEYRAVWPSIIDREDWEQVQHILAAQERYKGATKKGVRTYLLTGYVFCGICGKPLMASGGVTGNRPDREPHRAYRCRSINAWGVQHGCGKIRRLAEPLELLVADAVLDRYSSPDFADALKRAYQDNNEHDRLSELLDEAEGYKHRLQELEDEWKAGAKGLDLKSMLRYKADLEESIERVNAKMSRLSTGRVLAAIPAGKSIHEAWDKADLDQKRMLISLIVEKVVLLPGRPGSKRWYHKRTGQRFIFDADKVRIHWRI